METNTALEKGKPREDPKERTRWFALLRAGAEIRLIGEASGLREEEIEMMRKGGK